VESLNLLGSIDGTIESLRGRTTFLENLFSLMSEYLIPLSGEDTSMLAAIKSQLGNISPFVKYKNKFNFIYHLLIDFP